MFGKMKFDEDDDRKVAAIPNSFLPRRTTMNVMPVQYERENEDTADDPQTTFTTQTMVTDTEFLVNSRIASSIQNHTTGICYAIQAAIAGNEDMGWQMLVNHIETLLYTFPVLEEIFHMDQPDNRHVTIRGSTDPQDVSTVDFEDETSNDNGTLGTDTHVETNTTETDNEKNDQTDNGKAHTNDNDHIIDPNLTSRFNVDGSAVVPIPNTAQTQTNSVTSILSDSQGIDPSKVKPHIIKDKPKTRNNTELVSTRNTNDKTPKSSTTTVSTTNSVVILEWYHSNLFVLFVLWAN